MLCCGKRGSVLLDALEAMHVLVWVVEVELGGL
jgi:hypothetical protein